MTTRPSPARDTHDPCTQDAREAGCTCSMSSVDSASIDPPHEIIDKYCPLHGYALDPDYEHERQRDDELIDRVRNLSESELWDE
jgi:hypothetical protein